MPIGYLVTTVLMATSVVSSFSRLRPRRSSPFRLRSVFGFLLNWPFIAVGLLVASTGLAIAEGDLGPVFWIGLGLATVAAAGLVVLGRRAQGTVPAVGRALDEGLGAGWRENVDAELADRLRRRPSLAGTMFAPISSGRRRVERIANIRYGPAGRGNLLDLYRDRSGRTGRPTLIYLHPGAFRLGSKRLGARHLILRLASHGWVCGSANYRLGPSAKFPDPLIDVKRVIDWVREHGGEYGADPTAVFLVGSSAGGHLASMAALTPNDPRFQPGFETADTSVAGAICLYGYYGSVDSGEQASSPLANVSLDAPPCFVVHGDSDTLVLVEDARRFVDQLRVKSLNPVVYAELPGTQHGFDLFRSRRFETVVDGIEAFAAWTSARNG
ncbi:MAG TPA: alpha/beta hydrolase [Solirubrobacterales bacterium]|jgi:acetyl esterase/lipase